LLSILKSGLDAHGYESVSTADLLKTATQLAIKSSDKIERSLLTDILVELEGRDISEVESKDILFNLVLLLNRGGEEIDDRSKTIDQLAKDRLSKAKGATNLVTPMITRR
jgi:hypothetical protein